MALCWKCMISCGKTALDWQYFQTSCVPVLFRTRQLLTRKAIHQIVWMHGKNPLWDFPSQLPAWPPFPATSRRKKKQKKHHIIKNRWKKNRNQGAARTLSSAGLQKTPAGQTAARCREGAQSGTRRCLGCGSDAAPRSSDTFLRRSSHQDRVSFRERRWWPWCNQLQLIQTYAGYACRTQTAKAGGTQKWSLAEPSPWPQLQTRSHSTPGCETQT